MNIPNYVFAVNSDLQKSCDKFNLENPSEKPLSPIDFLPTRSDEKATGYDVRCADPDGVVLRPNCYLKFNLGFRMYAPSGWWLQITPRSSSFMKKHLHALYGVVDETFENYLLFVCQYMPDACVLLNSNELKKIGFGERIAQVIPVQRQDMSVQIVSGEELDQMFADRNGKRGTGGFGASGII